MSLESIAKVARDLEDRGTIFYKIENGFFYSTRHAPQITVQVEDPMFIRPLGDVLLRVFCNRGTVSLFWPYGQDEQSNPLPLFVGSHIEVFRDGFPLGPAPMYYKSDPTATVWATYEILGDAHRKELASWVKDPTKKLKMRYGEEEWEFTSVPFTTIQKTPLSS